MAIVTITLGSEPVKLPKARVAVAPELRRGTHVATDSASWHDAATVGDNRLTRQELGWLLAQEARSAAAKLREGVTQLKQPAHATEEARSKPPAMESSLDVLEDAIGMLSLLQSQKVSTARRGRIDVAALLYQLAPNARIVMEPGAGTEVFGAEEDLSRMLHVLVSLTGDPSTPSATASPEIRIRRDGDQVRISVELGPDRSATAEVERRWLTRMSMRLGGSVELEGGTQSLLLPADAAAEQREVAALRTELKQAQQLGESYARELAEVLSTGASTGPGVSAGPESTPPAQRFELLVRTAGALARSLRSLLEGLRSDLLLAEQSLPEGAPLREQLRHRVAAASDLLSELKTVADCPVDEPPREVDLPGLLEQCAAASAARATRRGIQIALDVASGPSARTRPQTFGVMLRALLDHAIGATPSSGQVSLRLDCSGSACRLLLEDGGPSVPDSLRMDLLKHRVDPTGLGRPGGVALLVADAAAEHLGLRLSIELGQDGGARFCVETRD